MNINDLNELTRNDLIKIDTALILLARHEHARTGNTVSADIATKAMNRIAVRYGLAVDEGYPDELAS
jgi:hypothetical protein